ncbi:hypothetical protein J4448_04150 [Candidatus Woesearchaeota archaeon]|nr:hypothetical protein [Candidatus Woesearchaeota archaeon]
MLIVIFGISLIKPNSSNGKIVIFKFPSINPGSSAVNVNSYCWPGIKSFILTHSPKHTSLS